MAPDALARFEANLVYEPNSGCWLWDGALGRDGYGRITIDGRSRRAHRVSYDHYIGPLPLLACVCHRCDVPICVNPGHLFLGTHAENMADMVAKGRGRGPRGESGVHAKLTAEKVVAIRAEAARGVPQRALAQEYGVAVQSINMVVRGKAWAHVKRGVNL